LSAAGNLSFQSLELELLDEKIEAMKFLPTSLVGAFIIELEPHNDKRGFFARSFCQEEFKRHGLPIEIKQSNLSFNQRSGTLRGMHYQRVPYSEAKLVHCIAGSIYDVIIDLRPNSPTYCHWHGVQLNAENHRATFIPEGMAHGFLTLVDETLVQYEMFESYHAELGAGVRYDDPVFGIEWPAEVRVISEKDQSWPDFIR